MYTVWKRTVPPPSLTTFDAPDREKCTARRTVTNTPLQALVLLNDPTYVEASRVLAEKTISQAGRDPAEAGRLCLPAGDGPHAAAAGTRGAAHAGAGRTGGVPARQDLGD